MPAFSRLQAIDFMALILTVCALSRFASLRRFFADPNVEPVQTDRPSTEARKPASALPPQMGSVLVRARFACVTCPLISHSLVVGNHPQNALVRVLVHSSRLVGYAACAPFELGP